MTSASIATSDDVRTLMQRHRSDPSADVVPIRSDVDTADFWNRRPVLTHVLEFARARRAGPWAVLAVTLARTVASVEPNVMLPPIVGGPVSLNMFAALVGPSGGGKGAAEGAARDAVRFVDHNGIDVDAETFTLGSGEGLARTFMPGGPDDEDGRRTRALFTVQEVDTLAALGGRTGSTLLPELRKLYSGETIGFQNANRNTRVVVPAHEYRACLTVGVQPAKAATLIHDADGGTPQRFVWLPVDDPDAPDVKPDDPRVWTVKAPRWGSDRVFLEVPDMARQAIDEHRLAVLRGEPVDPLDGHRMLSRLKIAAALALLSGQSVIGDEDWFLSGVVMAKSDRTRGRIETALSEQARRTNRARAELDGERAMIVDEVKSAGEMQRAVDGIVRHLSRKGRMSASDLRRTLRVNLREHFADAIATLVESGEVLEFNDGGREYFELA